MSAATDTIIAQVSAMKSLVDAFAQYARTPTPVGATVPTATPAAAA